VRPIIRVELEAFADTIAKRAPFPVSAADMLATVAAFEAVVEAPETGRTVAVDAQRERN
jgi:predicted dehydrogenase